MAKSLSERPQGKLPSNTETNPKENVSAITLRNNKVYPEPPYPSLTPNLNSDPPPVDDRRIPGVEARQDQEVDSSATISMPHTNAPWRGK